MDTEKLASMCLIPPTLRELMKKQQALEMQKEETFCKLWINKNASEFSVESDEAMKTFDKAIEINPPDSKILKIKDLSKSSIIIKIGVKWEVLMDYKNLILSTETDPVCKMQVDKRKAEFTSEYKRKTYYFCSLFCKKKFDEKLIE